MIELVAMPRRLPKYTYEDEDRHGNMRCYLRVPGQKKVRLPGSPWSEEFMIAYNAALDKPVVARAPEISGETWAWLCRRYFACPELKKLSTATQDRRRRILEKTFDEPIAPGAKDCFRDFPLSLLRPPHIKVLRDRLAETPEAANERLKAIRQVFKIGMEAGDAQHNPARDVGYIKTVTDGFYTWTEEDIQQFRTFHPSGTKPRRALELLLILGPRSQDAITLGRQKVRNGWLKFKPKKTENRSGIDVEIEIPPELAAELALMPAGDMLFIQTEFGKAYSVKGFGNWFKRQCVMAGLPQCSAHGVRKGGATQRAENGATDYQLMALYGWTSPKTAQVYTRKARRKKMAAAAVDLLIAPPKSPVGQKS